MILRQALQQVREVRPAVVVHIDNRSFPFFSVGSVEKWALHPVYACREARADHFRDGQIVHSTLCRTGEVAIHMRALSDEQCKFCSRVGDDNCEVPPVGVCPHLGDFI